MENLMSEKTPSETRGLESIGTDSIIAHTGSQQDKGASQNIDFCNTFTTASEPV